EGFTTLNTVSTIGAYILGLSMLPFMYNAWRSWVGKNERVVGDDPWGYGNSLEWATSCPPPRHNFVSIPRIRSERPAFDLHYPHAAGIVDDADISDGAGELGFFSPYSWAPLWCALAAATAFLGIVFGWWLFAIGAAFTVPAVGSMVFEYYSDAPAYETGSQH